MIAPPPPVAPAARRSGALFLVFPFLVLAAWIAAVTIHASVLVDGVRHFYLDDGQMVSMRYARNLVEGQGLVWNPGERVEGYSNPGWVLVMAAVHAAGAAPERAALYVKLVAALCAAGVLWWSLVLRRELPASTVAGDSVLLLALALNADVVFWAANGFETTLLTLLFLWLVVRTVREAQHGGPSPVTLAGAGLLPIVRSDAHLLAIAIVVLAVALCGGRDRTRALRLSLLTLVAPALHVWLRMAYYGDPLPNTFYLRQAATPGVWADGARYVRAFVLDYWIVLGLAAAGAVAGGGRRERWLLAICGAAGAQAVAAGGDMHAHFRVFAPVVPVVLVLAAAGVERRAGVAHVPRAIGLAVLLAGAVLAGGMVQRWPVEAMRSWRGKPWQGVVIGRLIERHSSPKATVAAADVGALGYFSRRVVFDLTGRTDRMVARLPARPGADAAARKFDVALTLARAPDFVLTAGPHRSAQYGEIMFAMSGVDPARDLGPAILSDPAFLREYRDSPVPLAPLLQRSAVYVRRDSSERPGVSAWTLPEGRFE